MVLWSHTLKVSGNRLSVKLPQELDAQEGQIIIIPKKKVFSSQKNEWKKDFLSISLWDISEDENILKELTIQEY